MQSVFSFAGVSDLSMGVKVTGITRSFRAAQRNLQTVIPGKSGTYSYTDGTFENTQITLDCMYTGTEPAAFMRRLAAWCKGTNDLVFADEPDKIYTASAWAGIPADYVQSLRHYTITFDCAPFARSAAVQQAKGTITPPSGAVAVQVEGTAPTPCRIEIVNSGSTTITEMEATRTTAAMAFSNYQFNTKAPFNRAGLATDSGTPLELGGESATLSFAPGDVMVIDTEALSITLNGTEDVSAWVVGSEFPVLEKGLNLLSFEAPGNGWELEVTVYWSDRWL